MLTRYREQLKGDRTRETVRLELMLEDASMKLSTVASSLTTVSARAMLAAMIEGESDARELAEMAKGKMQRKIPDLAQALERHFDAHHAQLARSILGDTQPSLVATPTEPRRSLCEFWIAPTCRRIFCWARRRSGWRLTIPPSRSLRPPLGRRSEGQRTTTSPFPSIFLETVPHDRSGGDARRVGLGRTRTVRLRARQCAPSTRPTFPRMGRRTAPGRRQSARSSILFATGSAVTRLRRRSR